MRGYRCEWSGKKIPQNREHTPSESVEQREWQEWLDTLDEHRYYFEEDMREVA